MLGHWCTQCLHSYTWSKHAFISHFKVNRDAASHTFYVICIEKGPTKGHHVQSLKPPNYGLWGSGTVWIDAVSSKIFRIHWSGVCDAELIIHISAWPHSCLCGWMLSNPCSRVPTAGVRRQLLQQKGALSVPLILEETLVSINIWTCSVCKLELNEILRIVLHKQV